MTKKKIMKTIFLVGLSIFYCFALRYTFLYSSGKIQGDLTTFFLVEGHPLDNLFCNLSSILFYILPFLFLQKKWFYYLDHKDQYHPDSLNHFWWAEFFLCLFSILWYVGNIILLLAFQQSAILSFFPWSIGIFLLLGNISLFFHLIHHERWIPFVWIALFYILLTYDLLAYIFVTSALLLIILNFFLYYQQDT